MEIGNYKLYVIQTGSLRLDGGAVFGVVPKKLWSKMHPADDENRVELCMRCLLLVSDKKKILINNGIGHKLNSKFIDMYSVNHTFDTLEKSLNANGFSTKDISDVILTHLHFDHAGGTTYLKDGKLNLTFPNAIHYVQKSHWEWAENPSEIDKKSFIHDNYYPVKKAGQLSLIEGNTFVDDYISLKEVNGHTRGQQVVIISDKKNILFFCSDLIPMAPHIHLPYINGYDLHPLVTLKEKLFYLTKIVEEDWIIFFEHDPFVETVKVQKNERGFFPFDKKNLYDR